MEMPCWIQSAWFWVQKTHSRRIVAEWDKRRCSSLHLHQRWMLFSLEELWSSPLPWVSSPGSWHTFFSFHHQLSSCQHTLSSLRHHCLHFWHRSFSPLSQTLHPPDLDLYGTLTGVQTFGWILWISSACTDLLYSSAFDSVGGCCQLILYSSMSCIKSVPLTNTD